MERHLRVAAAQMGPIHLADGRAGVVKRLVAMLQEAHAGGAKLVVFPELALTTFFPRYWYDDAATSDRYFESEMPNEAVQPLFDEAARLGVGFHLGYAELVNAGGAIAFGMMHRGQTAEEDIHGRIVGIAQSLEEILDYGEQHAESPVYAANRKVQQVLEQHKQASASV